MIKRIRNAYCLRFHNWKLQPGIWPDPESDVIASHSRRTCGNCQKWPMNYPPAPDKVW